MGFRNFLGKFSAAAETLFVAMTQSNTEIRPHQKVEGPGVDWQAALSEHDRWLRTVVYARLGEPQAVDDVLQEVSLAAVRQRSPIADQGKVAPWLYRLAVTQSLLYRRKQGRRRKLINNYAQRTRPAENDNRECDPLDWLLADERRRLVRAAVARLPKRDAEILLLKYSEDWSYRELADHLGISRNAVESRLHRARRRMRDILATCDVERLEL